MDIFRFVPLFARRYAEAFAFAVHTSSIPVSVSLNSLTPICPWLVRSSTVTVPEAQVRTYLLDDCSESSFAVTACTSDSRAGTCPTTGDEKKRALPSGSMIQLNPDTSAHFFKASTQRVYSKCTLAVGHASTSDGTYESHAPE